MKKYLSGFEAGLGCDWRASCCRRDMDSFSSSPSREGKPQSTQLGRNGVKGQKRTDARDSCQRRSSCVNDFVEGRLGRRLFVDQSRAHSASGERGGEEGVFLPARCLLSSLFRPDPELSLSNELTIPLGRCHGRCMSPISYEFFLR